MENFINIFYIFFETFPLCFLCLVSQGDNVGSTECEIFGAVTHLFWTMFWFWTGKSRNILKSQEPSVAGVEGYFLYKSVTQVFQKEAQVSYLVYVAAFMIPSMIITAVTSCSLVLDLELYIRFVFHFILGILSFYSFREYECSVSCWFNESSIWIYLATVGLVLCWNIAVTVKAVSVAYKSSRVK